jgi:hypothetical protein
MIGGSEQMRMEYRSMLSNADRIKVALVGGHTRRWHAADIIGEERVDSHTWAMLAIILILHPAPSVELLGAVTFHDSPGEPFSGDIPHGAKVAFPELGAADRSIGERAERALGVHYELGPEDDWWLRFADMAQALLFAKRQIAQGNTLMYGTLSNCTELLVDMIARPAAPANAAELATAIGECRMDLPMSRDLVKLEEQARG